MPGPAVGAADARRRLCTVGEDRRACRLVRDALHQTDRFGRRSGYAYEYQQKIAAYTGWTYEYVKGSWPELMQMLIDGEIDLMSDISYTVGRSKRLLYSMLPMGAEEYYVFVSAQNGSGINADILMDLLDIEDIQSERAENGQVAVDMFSDHPAGYYDAILMDVRMPVMNGLDAARAIRELSRPDAGEIPIIAMTANAFDEDVQLSLQAGMNAHLSKPVEPERLYETLEQMIGRRQ